MSNKARWFIPEVVQTSNMDCGPACLKSLLAGLGINVHYGRLRDACQTDVDGTSIDTLEEILLQLGVDAEQVVIPVDHLLLDQPKSLPAIVVVRLANGATHFVVAWRPFGSRLQVMDPATGRRWPNTEAFLASLHIHTMQLAADDWREWAGTDNFLTPLQQLMQRLSMSKQVTSQIVSTACADANWQSIAFVDALTRMLAALVAAKAINQGLEAQRLFVALFEQFQTNSESADTLVPAMYWCVRPISAPTHSTNEGENTQELQLGYSGAVVLKAKLPDENVEPSQAESVELRKALDQPAARPLAALWQRLKQDGALEPLWVTLAMLMAAMGVLVEILLFRGLIDIQTQLGLGQQRMAALVMLLSFILLLLLMEYSITKMLLRFGRRLESRFRTLFLQKIPQLGDRYFHSRPNSDLAERSHRLSALRQLPDLAGTLIQSLFSLLATVAGLIWLVPVMTPWILLLAGIQVVIPLLFKPLMAERDLRVRTHAGALGQFYLDALLGLIPIRAHGAENAIRYEHETLLAEWARASYAFFHLKISGQFIQNLLSTGLTISLIGLSISYYGSSPFLLLLVYWVLSLPQQGNALAQVIIAYPAQRNIALRALEPFSEELNQSDANSQLDTNTDPAAIPTPQTKPRGAAIQFDNVHVMAAGHSVLTSLNLKVAAGEHIAIVGESGAGKSSLVGLLLGWYQAQNGYVKLDGEPLNETLLTAFRQDCAWVDPSVQLWNSSFLDNLHYGNPSPDISQHIMQQAQLLELIATMPNGLQTHLGEGGGLVSGGEGQRVRLGRALGKKDARCVILDEPFRGLGRQQREQLLVNARTLWQQATLLCITHDISETQNFPRVLVMQNGQIAEDDSPKVLLADPDSVYSQLMAQEKRVQQQWQQSGHWRYLHIKNGQLHEAPQNTPPVPPLSSSQNTLGILSTPSTDVSQ
jgi:ATP-binding cassette subfamily B protein